MTEVIKEESTMQYVTESTERRAPSSAFRDDRDMIEMMDTGMAVAISMENWNEEMFDGFNSLQLYQCENINRYTYEDEYFTTWSVRGVYLMSCCVTMRVVMEAYFDGRSQFIVLDSEMDFVSALYAVQREGYLDGNRSVSERNELLERLMHSRTISEDGFTAVEPRDDDSESVDDENDSVTTESSTPSLDSDDSTEYGESNDESEYMRPDNILTFETMEMRHNVYSAISDAAVQEMRRSRQQGVAAISDLDDLGERVMQRIRIILRLGQHDYIDGTVDILEFILSDECPEYFRNHVVSRSVIYARSAMREEGIFDGPGEIFGAIKDTNDRAQEAFKNISASAEKMSVTADNIQKEMDALHQMAKRPDGSDALWEKIVSRIEDALFFFMSISSTSTISGAIAAIMMYIKTFISGPVIVYLGNVVTGLIHDIYKFCSQKSMTQQGGEDSVSLNLIRMVRGNWSNLRDSALLKSINETLTVVCAIFFTGDEEIVKTMNDSFKGLIQAKCWDFSKGSIGIIDMTLKVVEFFVSKGYAILNGAPITTLLHDNDDITELDERYRKIIKWKPLVHNGGLKMIGELSNGDFQTREMYWEEINKLKDKLIRMDKAEKHPGVKATLKKQIYQLDSLDTDIRMEQETTMFVEQPFTVLIFSGPGTGKTPFTIWTYKALCKATDYPTGIDSHQRHLCTMALDEEFDEEYNPSVHHTFNLQDLCNTKENKMKSDPLAKVRKFVENTPETVPRAQADRKGKDRYHWKNGLATTNIKLLHVHAFTIAPGSILRRWHLIVTVEPKANCVNDRGTFSTDEFFPDAWNIVVEKVVIVRDDNDCHKDTFRFEKVLETSSIEEYMRFIGNARIEHGKYQKAAMENIYKVNDCQLCEHFVPAEKCKECTYFKMTEEGIDESGDNDSCSSTSSFVTACEEAQKIERENTRGASDTLAIALDIGVKLAVGALAVGTIVGGLHLARNMFTKHDLDEQGALASIGKEPVAVEGEKENEWSKKKIIRVPMPLRRSNKAASTTPDNLIGCLTRAVFFFKRERDDGTYTGGVLLPLKGNLFLSTRHNIGPGTLRVANVLADQVGISELVQKITDDDISDIDGCDACVVRIVGLTTKKGYFDYLLEEDAASLDHLSVIGKFRPDWFRHSERRTHIYNSEMYDDKGTYVIHGVGGKLSNTTLVTGNSVKGYHYTSSYGTFSGMCGAPAVLYPKGGTAIVGIHVAGSETTNKSFILSINKGQVAKAMEAFERNIVPPSEGGIPAEQFGYNYDQETLRHEGCKDDDIPSTHCIKFIPEEQQCAVEFYGPHDRGMRNLRSSVRQTPISDDVTEIMGIKRIHGKPKRIGSYHPWQVNLMDTIAPYNGLDPDTLRDAQTSLEGKFRREVENINGSQYLHVWSYRACVNGIAGVSGADRINNATSAGDPICRPKKILSEAFSEYDAYGTITELIFDPRVEEAVNDIRSRVIAGERIYTIFQAHVKDEATKFTKENLRIFAGCQLAFLIFCKMYLGGFNRMLQAHWDKFECCISADCYNSDWTRLYNAVFKNKDTSRVMAGDYKRWDKSQTPQLILSTGEIVRNICAMGDYTADDLKCVEAIFVELAYPIYEWNGVYMQAYCTLPSGVFCTVLTSNMNNSQLMRYSYMKESPPKEYWRYDDHVSANFMGDDNLLCCDSECTWFNMLVHAKHMEAAGITYTSADKESELTAYVDVEDATYLKRRWVWNEVLQNYLAPIEESSIAKQLHNYMNNKNRVGPVEELCGSAVDSALREYFRHGKDVYEMRRQQLGQIVRKHELDKFVSLLRNGELPSYEMMVGYYLNGEPVSEPPLAEDGTLEFQCSASSPMSTMNNYNREESTINTSQRGLRLQGAEEQRLGVTFKDNTTEAQHQTATFVDVAPNTGYSFGDKMDPTCQMQDCADDELQNFFCRPVKIFSGVWSVGVATTTTIDPWSLFISNARNINRISNYFLLRGQLHLKILVNGNAFYYGRLMISYMPFHNDDEMQVPLNNAIYGKMLRSQRPHVFIDPTLSQGAEMVLPFFCETNNIDVVEGRWNRMGVLTIESVVSLAHANNITENISFSIFAHASDVHLSIPTSVDPASLVPQGADETDLHTGKVSGPASAIARMANKIADTVPTIAPYAMAGGMVAETVAGISRMMGWSRPKTTAVVATRFKPELAGNMANTDVAENAYSLALDSKNEVTIDPKVAGLKSIDEMTVSHIVAHESIISVVDWPTSYGADVMLYNVRVDPYIVGYSGAGMYMSSTAYASRPFEYWTGTINFRFQVVCSAYHKGRLRVVYDPAYFQHLGEWNINYMKVIDISECRDFTISVPMSQSRHFIRRLNDSHSAQMQSTSSILTNLTDYGNGVLKVMTTNRLTTAANITDPVSLIVSISGGDDLEFAVPSNDVAQLALFETPLVAQGAEETATVNDGSEPISPADDLFAMKSNDGRINQVYFGETFKSFRALVKRYNAFSRFPFLQPASRVRRVNTYRISAFPPNRGFQSDAMGLTVLSDPFNYSHTTMLNYLSFAYVGWRGSLRWKALYNGPSKPLLAAKRTAFSSFFRRFDSLFSIYNLSSDQTVSCSQYNFVTQQLLTNEGCYVTPSDANPVIEVEVPYYTNHRFQLCRLADRTSDNYNDKSQSEGLQFYVEDKSTPQDDDAYLDMYVAGGDDISFLMYVGPPVLYNILVLPDPLGAPP